MLAANSDCVISFFCGGRDKGERHVRLYFRRLFASHRVEEGRLWRNLFYRVLQREAERRNGSFPGYGMTESSYNENEITLKSSKMRFPVNAYTIRIDHFENKHTAGN